MMALVTVAMVGLGNFSDIGTGPAIAYNRRGDDPDFLDTAWTLHVIRGVLLWLATCALAWPFARFYGEPMLAQLLPVAGLSLLIGGLPPDAHRDGAPPPEARARDPARPREPARRHRPHGRPRLVDRLDLVAGDRRGVRRRGEARPGPRCCCPGRRNRFRWEPEARHELVHFGKWIFLSTVCGFLVAQGDRLILGKYLSLDLLGIYNLGYFLASFPLLLAGAVTGRVLIPLYRDCPPNASAANFQKLQLMRIALTGGVVALLLLMAFVGIPLVELLYDPRFHAAGPIVVLLACAQIPQAIVMTYDQAALAAGDSRRFFLLMAPRAVVLTSFLLVGVEVAGLLGALVGLGLATLAVYPLCRPSGAALRRLGSPARRPVRGARASGSAASRSGSTGMRWSA